jgi:hypothetical protein
MAKSRGKEGLLIEEDLVLVAEGLIPDAKNRIALTRAVREEGVHYNVYRNQHGQIVLDPQKSVPAYEAWLFEDPQAIASLKRGLQQASEGKVKRIGSPARPVRKEA